MTFAHLPVLLAETVDCLTVGLSQQKKIDWSVIDATLGGGGHSSALVRRLFELMPNARVNLLGCDQDSFALEKTRPKLCALQDEFPNFTFALLHTNFRNVPKLSEEIQKTDLFLADLGMSSPQLDDPTRGFALTTGHPPDMRMDRRNPKSAATVLETADETALTRIFRDYADEPRSARLAKAICAARLANRLPLAKTEALAEFIDEALGYGHSRKKPAIRIFQALRMEVNDETGALSELLADLPRIMQPQHGRAAFISFHSIEDRMIKRSFRDWEERQPSLGCEAPRGGVVGSDAETAANPRARSARLRVFWFGESRRGARSHMRQAKE